MKRILVLLIVISFSFSQQDELYKIDYQALAKYKKAYFAAGCFWCVEAIFESVEGVKEVVSGYSGGPTDNPTYVLVANGLTMHAEAVEVYYDPKVVSFKSLVRVFFGSHDPTTINRQGPDIGAHYRSIAFYQTAAEKKIIYSQIRKLESEETFDKPIVTSVEQIKMFFPAEAFHQDFEKRNPFDRYIIFVSTPRLNRFKARFPELLKDDVH